MNEGPGNFNTFMVDSVWSEPLQQKITEILLPQQNTQRGLYTTSDFHLDMILTAVSGANNGANNLSPAEKLTVSASVRNFQGRLTCATAIMNLEALIPSHVELMPRLREIHKPPSHEPNEQFWQNIEKAADRAWGTEKSVWTAEQKEFHRNLQAYRGKPTMRTLVRSWELQPDTQGALSGWLTTQGWDLDHTPDDGFWQIDRSSLDGNGGALALDLTPRQKLIICGKIQAGLEDQKLENKSERLVLSTQMIVSGLLFTASFAAIFPEYAHTSTANAFRMLCCVVAALSLLTIHAAYTVSLPYSKGQLGRKYVEGKSWAIFFDILVLSFLFAVLAAYAAIIVFWWGAGHGRITVFIIIFGAALLSVILVCQQFEFLAIIIKARGPIPFFSIVLSIAEQVSPIISGIGEVLNTYCNCRSFCCRRQNT